MQTPCLSKQIGLPALTALGLETHARSRQQSRGPFLKGHAPARWTLQRYMPDTKVRNRSSSSTQNGSPVAYWPATYAPHAQMGGQAASALAQYALQQRDAGQDREAASQYLMHACMISASSWMHMDTGH